MKHATSIALALLLAAQPVIAQDLQVNVIQDDAPVQQAGAVQVLVVVGAVLVVCGAVYVTKRAWDKYEARIHCDNCGRVLPEDWRDNGEYWAERWKDGRPCPRCSVKLRPDGTLANPKDRTEVQVDALMLQVSGGGPVSTNWHDTVLFTLDTAPELEVLAFDDWYAASDWCTSNRVFFIAELERADGEPIYPEGACFRLVEAPGL